MGEIIQVLLYSTLFLLVYGQQQVDRNSQIIEERKRISDLLALSQLLQTAARLAYPITSGINNVVGNFVEPNDHRLPSNYPYNSHEKRPAYAPGRRTNINRNKIGRKSSRDDLRNLPRVNSQDVYSRRSHRPSYYDYEYDYEYDYDYGSHYLANVGSSELGNDFIFHNSGVQSETETHILNTNRKAYLTESVEKVPKHKLVPATTVKPINIKNADIKPRKSSTRQPATKLPNQVNVLQKQLSGTDLPLTNDNASGNVPASNDAQPNIIYVVLNPSDIKPGTNVQNPINLLNSEGLNSNGDGSNTINGYYIVPSSSAPDLIPGLIPAKSSSTKN